MTSSVYIGYSTGNDADKTIISQGSTTDEGTWINPHENGTIYQGQLGGTLIQPTVIISGQVYFRPDMYPTEGGRVLTKGGLVYIFDSPYPVRVCSISDKMMCECGRGMELAADAVNVYLKITGYEEDMWVEYESENLPLPGYTCQTCEKSCLRIWGF